MGTREESMLQLLLPTWTVTANSPPPWAATFRVASRASATVMPPTCTPSTYTPGKITSWRMYSRYWLYTPMRSGS